MTACVARIGFPDPVRCSCPASPKGWRVMCRHGTEAETVWGGQGAFDHPACRPGSGAASQAPI